MELRNKLAESVAGAVNALFAIDVEPILTVSDEKHGDFATNVALQVAGRAGKNPREVAEMLCAHLGEQGVTCEVAGPGFINIQVSDDELWAASNERHVRTYEGQKFVVEYSCPNYFKELHAGHLYQTLYGDVVARMIERSGAMVHRTNFGADVGLSAARAMWGILNALGGEYPEKLADIPEDERTKFIAARYVDGAKADTDDNDDAASQEIKDINKRIYEMHASGDTTSAFATVYFTTREWCRQYFMRLYEELQVDQFEKYYPESTTEARGVGEVRAHIGSVFSESSGAIVFEGEAEGLHTRVFITSQGLPTYEAKDLGLILMEMEEFEFDRRVLLTGNEQAEYMKVVWRAADKVYPGIEARMTHLTNGLIRFGDGKKMSSRLGNVTTAMDVIGAVRTAVGDSGDAARDRQIYLGALKYELLKHRLGGDIAFDPESSVSLVGNSGPYLQYALVRAKSIIGKVEQSLYGDNMAGLEPAERSLVRKLSHYQMVLEEATRNLETHGLCLYLYELAGEFNVFYEKNRVLDDPRSALRMQILQSYHDTLADGLSVLGIEAPERM